MAVAVVCISRDTGGTRTLLRVAEELRKSCEEVFYLAQAGAMAEKILAEADEPFQVVASIEEIVKFVGDLESGDDPRPCVMLMSWCAEMGRAVVPFLNEQGVLTVLVEDSWWHGGVLDSLEEDGRPRLVCVGTEHDRRRVLLGWPGYPQRLVRVTGWPAFDRYAGLDVPAIAEGVREELGLHEDWPIILLGIDNLPGSGQMVVDFVESLNEIGLAIYLVPAFHPAFDRSVPEERPLAEGALARFKSGLLVDRGTVETTKLVATADIVAAMFSTILAEAAVLRKQTVAILYPNTGQQYMQAEMGVEEFPLVELGCAAGASNCDKLRGTLGRALGPGLGLEEAQGRHFRIDGLNARRVAELIV